jgi:hypothetical protein
VKTQRGAGFSAPIFNHMKKLSDIPRLTEAIQYLNAHKETPEAKAAVTQLRERFGYSISVANDVLELWLESANSQNPITFLSE